MQKPILITISLILSLILFLASGCGPRESPPPVIAPETQNGAAGNDNEVSEDPMDDRVLLPEERMSEMLSVREAFPGTDFSQPLDFQIHEDQTSGIHIVEKRGRIYRMESSTDGYRKDLFLDISDRVDTSASEKGLLGLAFHPDFVENGLFYLNYTNRAGTVVSEFSASENRLSGLADSERVLLEFYQPFSNHNAGKVAFGPDGYFYIATGDGGSAGDPRNLSQDTSDIHGNILRIDVDRSSEGKEYAIPEDNPFVGNQEGILEEIYAYGLRNPWKFSFDEKRDWLWVADVGQNKVEEINLVEPGKNYGWNIMEGTLCYPESADCDQSGLELPVFEYYHPVGKSITGGYVYYGQNFPELYQAYVYGDFITGKIWALWLDEDGNTDNRLIAETSLRISSFGLDHDGEIYVIDYLGSVYELAQQN